MQLGYQAVSAAKEQGYFEPICTQRHLSVRHYTFDVFKQLSSVTVGVSMDDWYNNFKWIHHGVLILMVFIDLKWIIHSIVKQQIFSQNGWFTGELIRYCGDIVHVLASPSLETLFECNLILFGICRNDLNTSLVSMNLHLQGWCFALQSSSATMGPEEYLSKPTSSTSSFLRHDFPTCFSAWNWAGTYMWRSKRQNNENFQTSFQLCSIWKTSPFGLCIIHHNLKMELLRWSIYLPCHIQGLACLHGCSAAVSNTFCEVLLWSATLKIVLLLYIFGARDRKSVV